MDLKTFLAGYEGGAAAFADAIGVRPQAVYRYADRQRIPRPAVMVRITAATSGAVTATDFYPAADAIEHANDQARRAGTAMTMAPCRHQSMPEAA